MSVLQLGAGVFTTLSFTTTAQMAQSTSRRPETSLEQPHPTSERHQFQSFLLM